MYRQSLQRAMSETEVMSPPGLGVDSQIIRRVSSLPIVTAAFGQFLQVYNATKESNRLVKYTLETAESGVKTVATTAIPIVNKLETPISKIDGLACNQLDYMEEKFPILNKSTEQWTKATTEMYEGSRLKPAVDKVSEWKDYSVDTVSGVKSQTYEKIGDVKQYSFDKMTTVKDYGVDKITNVKDYSVSTVYTAATYSGEKINDALQTPYGQVVKEKLDKALDVSESYLDYYLPADKDNKEVASPDKKDTLNRALVVGNKARQRMYKRALTDMKQMKMRTMESLDQLTHTVDLIEYAKTNLDGAKNSLTAVPNKLSAVWLEINMSEEDAANEKIKDSAENSRSTFEHRIIATARHLTLHVKNGVHTLSSSFNLLPTSLQTQATDLGLYFDDLYNSFNSARSFKDIPSVLMTQIKDKSAYVQETISFMYEYLQKMPVLGLLRQTPADDESIEMEEVRDKKEDVASSPEEEETSEEDESEKDESEKEL